MPPKLKSSKEIVKNCKSSLNELKAINVCSFDVEEISSFTSFIMIASGTSSRHIQSIAEKVIENLKNKKIEILGTEGIEAKDWILIDAGEVIINIMSEDSREHYDLESLWDRKTK
ncbi:MAG: ribosome silencing factor [Gammaproteobacteria bacterium TMED112]|nr:MAG: ribosome silencing factor [Gammaproteobacteria bacterium TMED112]|tara:strand:- start:403 stop:747 length:345 start_codon:yes stop_codon:yes gene_type:complete